MALSGAGGVLRRAGGGNGQFWRVPSVAESHSVLTVGAARPAVPQVVPIAASESAPKYAFAHPTAGNSTFQQTVDEQTKFNSTPMGNYSLKSGLEPKKCLSVSSQLLLMEGNTTTELLSAPFPCLGGIQTASQHRRWYYKDAASRIAKQSTTSSPLRKSQLPWRWLFFCSAAVPIHTREAGCRQDE